VLLSAFDEHCDTFIDKTPQVTEDAYPVDLGTLNQTQQATKYADWLGLSSDVRNRL
jgi:hypothetical protein